MSARRLDAQLQEAALARHGAARQTLEAQIQRTLQADRSVDKRKGRAVLRGDLHKVHYGVDANQATAPVVRNTSTSAVDRRIQS